MQAEKMTIGKKGEMMLGAYPIMSGMKSGHDQNATGKERISSTDSTKVVPRSLFQQLLIQGGREISRDVYNSGGAYNRKKGR